MGATRHVILDGPRIKGTPKEIILVLSTLVTNVVNYSETSKPLIILSDLSLNNGFNRTAKYKGSKDYLLISSLDETNSQSEFKLVRICDGKMLHKWTPDIKLLNEQFNSTKINGVNNHLTVNSTALVHPFLMNDGSLIFGAGCIFRLDKNSNIVWSNTTPCHHSIEPDPDGNFWICSFNSDPKNSEKYQIMDDAVKKISVTDGKILFEKSVFEILMENGYDRGHFFINPQNTSGSSYLDYMHLNDVQPVFEDSRYWKRGDLFLSLRHQNLVLLYRPSTNKIIWSQNGPWLRQHDVDVIDSTRIGIFGNNVIDAQFANAKDRLIDGYNKQYIYDFSKNESTTPYDAFFETANIGTYTGGRSRMLPNGDIFVESTIQGRFLYGNYKEEIWSYIERIDKKRLRILYWSRYITEEEFKKVTFEDDQKNE